jgi:hypothetical protein
MNIVIGVTSYPCASFRLGGQLENHSGYLEIFDFGGQSIQKWTGLGTYNAFKFEFPPTAALLSVTFDEMNTFAVGSHATPQEQYTHSPHYVFIACQWQISDDKSTWTDIEDATTPNYLITEADFGKYLRRITTAYGGAYGVVVSEASDAVVGILTAASITGTAQVGQTLTAGTTTVPANAGTPTYAYQWFKKANSSAAPAAIESATSATYVLDAADEGYLIEVEVIATGDAIGYAYSEPTEAVAPVSGGK